MTIDRYRRVHGTDWAILVLCGIVLVLWWGTSEAKTGLTLAKTIVVEAEYSPKTGGYQKLTGLGTKQSLTVPAGAYRCLFYAEDDACRWNDDGTDPDPATKVGGVIAAGQYFAYAGDLDAIEVKGTATTILHVWYYGL